MTSLATRLGPLDVAALLPQLGRLEYEIVSAPDDEAFSLQALAAAGLPALPTGHVAIGVRNALRYRGLLLARQLAGGSCWEVHSLRVAGEHEWLVSALLAGANQELMERAVLLAFVRFSNPAHEPAFRRAGYVPYAVEHLYAVPTVKRAARSTEGSLTPAGRADQHGVFRLYCRAVPEPVRRHEAITLDHFAALRDAAGIEQEAVARREDGAIDLWVAAGPRESRMLAGSDTLMEQGLDHVESAAAGHRLLVPDYDEALLAAVERRGYRRLGSRTAAARQFARPIPLAETVSVPAGGTISMPNR